MSFELDAWRGENVLVNRDLRTGAWSMIALHSTRLGPAVGGTRMKSYATADDALADCMRLAEGMTYKTAVAGLPAGGGKAVLAVPPGLSADARARLLLDHGRRVADLGGRFVTGPDMGTGETDMDLLGTVTGHVFCRSLANGGAGTASPWTAAGVLAAIEATIQYEIGSRRLDGMTVLVQGIGEVGARLARLLSTRGARLLLSDIDQRAVDRLISELPGATALDPGRVYATECDVYSPCAVGATLSQATIPQLRCRMVVGAANNQLAGADDAERLRRQGIRYAPDFVANAGGIIRAVGSETLHWSDDEIDARIAAIGTTLLDIYERSDASGASTAAAALRIAEERLGADAVAA